MKIFIMNVDWMRIYKSTDEGCFILSDGKAAHDEPFDTLAEAIQAGKSYIHHK